jgi:hypothetical protein
LGAGRGRHQARQQGAGIYPQRDPTPPGSGGGSYLIVEASEDGAIVLRPAAVYPIEIYTDERIKEFEEEGRISDEEWRRVQGVLRRSR